MIKQMTRINGKGDSKNGITIYNFINNRKYEIEIMSAEDDMILELQIISNY